MDDNTMRFVFVISEIGTFIVLFIMLILIAITLWKFRR